MSGKLNIGLFGLGTVGCGVVELLSSLSQELERRYGVSLNLKRIVVRNLDKPRAIEIDRSLLTDDPRQILDDRDIDIVVEVMGGISPAREYILEALRRKKHVITANKAVIAKKGPELLRQSIKSDRFLGFRASVTGLLDIFERLSTSISIQSLVGVLNGTSNYILTEMEKQARELPEILAQAQALGYAEEDPSLDIDGYDTADKVAVLCLLAFASPVRREQIYTEGIRQITQQDIQFAGDLGYRIKLLGIARLHREKLEVRVHPCLVSKDKALARLEGVENGLQIYDELRGQGGFTAPGAGKYPAAYAIIYDLVNVITGKPVYFPDKLSRLPLLKMNEVKSEYYLRVGALNQPGVLEKIAGVFRRYDINIMSVFQPKESRGERGEIIPLAVIVDRASEGGFQRAVSRLRRLEVIHGPVSIIRVEESLW